MVVALEGDSILRAITLQNRSSAEKKTFPTRWLFVCIGGVPHTDWALQAGCRARRSRLSHYWPRFVAQREVYAQMAARPQPLSPGNERTGIVRRGRRSSTARSNDVPQRWARARWRSPSFTAILRPDDAIHGIRSDSSSQQSPPSSYLATGYLGLGGMPL